MRKIPISFFITGEDVVEKFDPSAVIEDVIFTNVSIENNRIIFEGFAVKEGFCQESDQPARRYQFVTVPNESLSD